jgi:predicted DsbA family dithiol-disulfide isomerase
VPRIVEVFADIACPFAHVGLQRLRAARDASHSEVALVVRAWPLELVNGHPLAAAEVAEDIEDLRAQVAPDLFTGFDVEAFPPTSIPAFGLAGVAYEQDAATGEAASFALREALFERGENVADPGVVAELAADLGVQPPDLARGRAAAERDWHEGRARCVVGSPHFFVDGHGEFCPALRIARVDDRHLSISRDDARLRGFLERVLG